MALILGGLLALIPLFFTIQTGKLKPGTGWVDFGGEIVGQWLHKAVVFLLLGWCIYYVSYDIQNFVLFFGGNYLRGTPPLFIQIVIGLVIMYTAHLGFSSIVYMSDGIALIFIFSTLFSVYLFIQNANFAMLPAFIHYYNPHSLFKDSISVLSWLGEWVVFLFIAPELKLSNRMLKRFSVTTVILIVIMLLGWAMTMLNFGPYLGKDLQYPYLQLVQTSSSADLMGNADPLLIGIWSFSMFIHSAFLIYVAYKCALYLWKQKAEAYYIPVMTFCSIIIAYLYSKNVAKYTHDYYAFSTQIIWLNIEFIPMYYYIVAAIRMKAGRGMK
ncbi:GerAB/ArcD/ProY family transporter [Paenibacillus sp. FSL K6-1096]|uniref:GerAB/ArcD/ProY family transporter n=1 Tax=Paenibacillus sp. FSL K6-1096 TaxID=2921460 RepID=UPI0030EBE267